MKRALPLLLSFSLFVGLLAPYSAAYAKNKEQASTIEITDAETLLHIFVA